MENRENTQKTGGQEQQPFPAGSGSGPGDRAQRGPDHRRLGTVLEQGVKRHRKPGETPRPSTGRPRSTAICTASRGRIWNVRSVCQS